MKLLIIGGGIAGTTLAQHCIDRNMEFRLVEKGTNECSQMAAGIMNPLVFRRINVSWRVAEMLPFAADFYRRMETRLNGSFFSEIPIRRLFASEQEAGYWRQKQDQPVYSDYLKSLDEADAQFPSEKNTFGTGVVRGSAIVKAAQYIPAQWRWLEEQGKLDRSAVDYAAIDPVAGTYKGEAFDCIVFAEGKDGRSNPWFNFLPLQATKGELLTIEAPTLSQSESLNRKCFLFPLGNGQFRVGSTYVWDTDDTTITTAGREAIVENLGSVTDEPFTIVDQQAGVRPTVTDRRPLLGKHPEYPKLAIANGLGTKGFMMAPLLMRELLEHLTEGKALHPEADIVRFAN